MKLTASKTGHGIGLNTVTKRTGINDMAQPNFIQLTTNECDYLVNLINEVDGDTAYTARQRTYTIPKLFKIREDARGAKLAYQDVDYLLELLEDSPPQEESLMDKLVAIRDLQDNKFAELKSIEDQRSARRLKASMRSGDLEDTLQKHFVKTTAKD
jgi:hypothetical protein